MRILVTAYACEPNMGSEPGIGWNVVRDLARRHEVWVVTRRNNAPSIRAELDERPVSGLHFVYHDLPGMVRLKKLPGGVWWYHYAWHMSLGPLTGRLQSEIGFDLAQHLTFGSFRYPGVLYRLGIPTIVGPVGGAEEPPLSFLRGMCLRDVVTELLRYGSNRVSLVDPFLRRALRRADLVLAVSPETQAAILRIVGSETEVGLLPLIGVDPDRIPPPTNRTSRAPRTSCTALHVGRLEGWKGAHLAIAALAEARRRGADVRLTILGLGPNRSALGRLAAELGVTDSVHFMDRWLTLDETFECFREHDVFVFPSLRESGGMALIEAMAAGLPAVTLRLGGPAVSVNDESGFRVSPAGPGEAVAGMATALERLATDPELRRRMGDAAADRIRQYYAWAPKGKLLDQFYQAVLNEEVLPSW